MSQSPLWWAAIILATASSWGAGLYSRHARHAYQDTAAQLRALDLDTGPRHLDALDLLARRNRRATRLTVAAGTVTVGCAVLLVAGWAA